MSNKTNSISVEGIATYRGEYRDDAPVLSITSSNVDVIKQLLSQSKNKNHVNLLALDLPACFQHHDIVCVTCSAIETTASIPLIAVAYPPNNQFVRSCKVVSSRIPVASAVDVEMTYFSVVDKQGKSLLQGVSETNLKSIAVVFKVESETLDTE